jgi:pilus assembly protein TadC
MWLMPERANPNKRYEEFWKVPPNVSTFVERLVKNYSALFMILIFAVILLLFYVSIIPCV